MSFIRHDAPYQCVDFAGETLPWIGGDLQTMRHSLIGTDPLCENGEHVLIDLPDGDQLLGAYHEADTDSFANPKGLIIIIHGLAGDYNGVHPRLIARSAKARGFSVLRICMRGAGAGHSYAKSSYHAGRYEDIGVVVTTLRQRFPNLNLFICAYSLGGTIAVNFMARSDASHLVDGAITFCAPIDMVESAKRFHSPRNRIYNRYFTKSLIAHALKRKLDDGVSKAELAKIKSVRDYDDKITCHIAGYEDADAYYEGSSPLPHLSKITTPTMLVHSDNDPLIPVDAYQKINTHNSLFCVITRGGGHVGFHSRRQSYDCWQTEMAMQFFEWRVGDIKTD